MFGTNFENFRKNTNNLKWLGEVSQKKIYQLADIILILSKYGEGIPKVALGQFIIKVHHVLGIPGCRDVINNKVNGDLIKLDSKMYLN